MNTRGQLTDRLARLTAAGAQMTSSAAGDLRALQHLQRARYLRDAQRAARAERAGCYAAAAMAWETALTSAQGRDMNWCRSRMALCLLFARSPLHYGNAAGRRAG